MSLILETSFLVDMDTISFNCIQSCYLLYLNHKRNLSNIMLKYKNTMTGPHRELERAKDVLESPGKGVHDLTFSLR